MKKFNRSIRNFLKNPWKLGLVAGAAVGVVAVMLNIFSAALNYLPAKVLQIFSVALPMYLVDTYFPIIFYAGCGAIIGWLWDNRKDVFDISLYTENKVVGVALSVLLLIPLLGTAGNSMGLWCAGCGTGSVEVTVSSGGAPVGDGLVRCILSETSGNFNQWTQSVSGGKAVFRNFGTGITYDMRCYCIANPTGSGTTTQHVYFYNGQTVSKTASISCGGSCAVTDTCQFRQCYQSGLYCYNNCNVRTGSNLCATNQICKTYNNVDYCEGSDVTSTTFPPTCNNQCEFVGACVDDSHRCKNIWDSNLNAYCKKLVLDSSCYQEPETTTTHTTQTTQPCVPTSCMINGCPGTTSCPARVCVDNPNDGCPNTCSVGISCTTAEGCPGSISCPSNICVDNPSDMCPQGSCNHDKICQQGETSTCSDCAGPDYTTILIIVGVVAAIIGVILLMRKKGNTGGTV